MIVSGKEDLQGKKYEGGFLCDLFHAKTAEVIAVYGKSFLGGKERECFYTGMPALTVNRYGAGYAYYLGCEPDAAFMKDWILQMCREAGIRPLFSFEGKLELTCRENENGQYVFVINHGDSEGRVLLDKDGQVGAYRDLLRDKEVLGSFTVASGDGAVLYRKEK